MEKIISEMNNLHKNGESFVLASVISRNGSAPRSAGAKMIVRSDFSITGTIGGGALEAAVIRLARQVMSDHQPRLQFFSFTGTDASTMDAICGGEIEVMIEYFDVHDPETAPFLQALSETSDRHQKGWWLTQIDPQQMTRHWLISNDFTAAPLPAQISRAEIQQIHQVEHRQNGLEHLIIEPVNLAGTAYIFGAGHVSQSLARDVKGVGFWTVVLDDRADFANVSRFPEADEIIVLDSYSDIFDRLRIDENSFIVIVTRGHLHDRVVLQEALRTSAGYIGMIGSRHKCELVYQEMMKNGFTRPDFERVHAPIGLSISAETPEEIGISITAEMIRARAEIAASHNP
jgi:xanthine dehydrogenase accessory factor